MAGHGIDLSGLINPILAAANQSDKAIDKVKDNAKKAVDEVAEYIEDKAFDTGKKVGKTIANSVKKEVEASSKDVVDVLIDEKEAKTRRKDLYKSMKVAAEEMGKIMKKTSHDSDDYGNMARFSNTLKRNQSEVDVLTNKLKKQGVVIRNNTKEYKELRAVLEDIGFVEKKPVKPKKAAVDEAALQKQVKAQTKVKEEVLDTVKAREKEADAVEKTVKAAEKQLTLEQKINAAKSKVKKSELLEWVEALEDKEEIYDAKTTAQKRKAAERLLKDQFSWYKAYKEAYDNDGMTSSGELIDVDYDAVLRQQGVLEAYIALYEKYGGKVEKLSKGLQELATQNGYVGAYKYAVEEYDEQLKLAEESVRQQEKLTASTKDHTQATEKQIDAQKEMQETVEETVQVIKSINNGRPLKIFDISNMSAKTLQANLREIKEFAQAQWEYAHGIQKDAPTGNATFVKKDGSYFDIDDSKMTKSILSDMSKSAFSKKMSNIVYAIFEDIERQTVDGTTIPAKLVDTQVGNLASYIAKDSELYAESRRYVAAYREEVLKLHGVLDYKGNNTRLSQEEMLKYESLVGNIEAVQRYHEERQRIEREAYAKQHKYNELQDPYDTWARGPKDGQENLFETDKDREIKLLEARIEYHKQRKQLIQESIDLVEKYKKLPLQNVNPDSLLISGSNVNDEQNYVEYYTSKLENEKAKLIKAIDSYDVVVAKLEEYVKIKKKVAELYQEGQDVSEYQGQLRSLRNQLVAGMDDKDAFSIGNHLDLAHASEFDFDKVANQIAQNLNIKSTSAEQEQLTSAIEATTEARKEETKATAEATEAKKKYYAIDEKAARISKQMRSFDDYKEGSVTASYRASVDAIEQIVNEKKAQFPDKAEQLDKWFDQYSKNLAQYINRDNQIGAQYPSVMISGSGNYNIKKHNKQMASWGKNYQFYEDKVAAIESKIKNLGSSGTEVIRGDEEDALEKLEAKVEYMKYWHQVMVEANKYYRKNKTLDGFEGAEPDEIERVKKALADMKQIGIHDVPYPQYKLTNDNQNIKRLEDRISELKSLKENSAPEEVNDIYKLWTDKQDMRIRISFEIGKPDQEIIDLLKGKSFKWSRSNGVWQRQLTKNAVYDTKRIQEKLHDFYDIGSEPIQQPELPKATETDVLILERVVDALTQLGTVYGAPLQQVVRNVIKDSSTIQSEIKDVLNALNLLDDNGKFSGHFTEQGYRNNGVVMNSTHAILARDADTYTQRDDPEYYEYNFAKGTYLDNLIAKMQEAKDKGVSLARILDVIHVKNKNRGEHTYEIQELAAGDPLHLIGREKTLDNFEQECARIVGATDEKIQKLMSDIIELNNLGFKFDFGGGNILFDTAKGFTLIDLELRELSDDVPTVTKLMERLFNSLVSYTENDYRFSEKFKDFGKPENTRWIVAMESVVNRLYSVFSGKNFGVDVDSVSQMFFKPIQDYNKSLQEIQPIEQQIPAVQKLTSSYEGLAEAVQEFYDAHAKSREHTGGMDDKFWELERVQNEKRNKLLEFIPNSDAHREAYASLEYRLNRKESRDKQAASPEYILKVIEKGIEKAKVELAQKEQEANDAIKNIGALLSKYPGDNANVLFGSLPTINLENAKEIYRQLIVKEKEYLESGAKSVAAFAERNKFLEQSVELTEKLKDNEQFMQQHNEMLRMVSDDIHTSESAMGILGASAQAIFAPVATEKPVSFADDLKDFTPEELQTVLNGINLDNFFKSFGIAEEHIDSFKKKFVDIVKVSHNFFNGNIEVDPTADMLDSLTNDVVKFGQEIIRTDKIYADFQKRMTNVSLLYDDTIKAEYGDSKDWFAFYKANQAYLSKSKNKKGKNVVAADTLMPELVESFGGLFSEEDLQKPYQDQFKKIMDVWSKARAEFKQLSTQAIPIADDYYNTIRGSLENEWVKSYTNAGKLTTTSNEALDAEGKLFELASGVADQKERQDKASGNAAQKTEDQVGAEKKLKDDDDEASQPEAVPIIQKQIDGALAQIREAQNNPKILDQFKVDLTGLKPDKDGPYSKDLELQIGELVKKSLGSGLSVGKVDINKDIAAISLYNKELGVTTQQIWQLEKATEDATEARLKFVSADKLSLNFEQAEKYAKAQEDALNKSEKQIIQYQKRLNDATLKYQHGNKKLDGNKLQLLDPNATSLKDSVDPTIDDLANHIQQRLNDSLGTVISDATRNEIERDLNALLNNIKIQQADKYKSGRMSATEVAELRTALVNTLDTAAARARKGNVFDTISESYNKLKNNLTDQTLSTYFTDENIDDAVQKIRTFGAEVTKAMAIGSEQKKVNQDLQNALNLQERLYAAKKKLAEFDVKGDTESSGALAAQRNVKALEEQFNISKQLLTQNAQKNKLAEQEVQLNKELETFQNEQLNNVIKQISILEDKVTTQIGTWSQNKTMEFLPKSFQSEINQFQASLSTLDENSDLQQIEQRWNDITNKVKAATKANQEYVNSYYKNEFQNSYQYTGGKTASDQQTLDSMADYYRQEEQSAQQFNDNIKSIYNQLIGTFKQINDLDVKINNLSLKDGGSGFYSKTIESLQAKKSSLIADVRKINEEITKSLTLDSASGQSGLTAFFEDARVQATLTSEEIQKFGDILRHTDEIKFNFGAKLLEQIQPVIEKIANLKQMIIDGDISSDSQMAKNILNTDADITSKVGKFKADPSATSAINVLKTIEVYSDYLNTIDKAAQKEKAYFQGKQEYVSGFNLENQAINQTTKEVEELLDVRKKLEGAAQDFAQNGAFITNFTKNADGISRLDFSVFDSATNSMRNFTMEMGDANQKMFVTETTIKKSLANIQAAQKQLQSTTSLLGKLDASGISIKEDGTATQQVQQLLSKYRELQDALKPDSGASQNDIVKLTSDLKIASSATERLYKQMIQMQGAIEGGQAKSLGIGDPKGNVYDQLINGAHQLASEHKGATLSIGQFDKATNTLNVSLTHAGGRVESFKLQMSQLNGQMISQQTGTKQLATSWDKFKASVAGAGKQLATAFAGYNVMYKVISAVRSGVQSVKEIDLALTELKKVTDETEESYRNFLNTAASSAGKIGSTVSEFTEATANFARLGYTMEDSAKMAEAATVYKNVADGIDTVEAATDSIISTMKAFGIESNDTMQIIDVFNEVGNNFAITSAGIGEAMQRSASALHAAGNTFEESTALITAANSVIQNPESVGTALKTLALRLRGAKVELEEAGLETEGMVESTSTLQEKLKALTGGKVDIMLDADTFKNTTQILREMSEVWSDMSDIEQASALELMGGKRQANILASLITNFETVEDVIETSMNSSGSAIQENEKWMDSIAGKANKLSNNMQSIWNKTLSSDMIKGFYDIAIAITDVVDEIGLLVPALVAVGVYFTAFKKNNPVTIFKDLSANINAYSQAVAKVQAVNTLNIGGTLENGAFDSTKVNAYAAAISNLTVKQQASVLASQGLTQAQMQQVLATNGATDADIKLAIAETQVAAAKQQTNIATGSQLFEAAALNNVRISESTLAFLAEHAEEELTKAKLKNMLITGQLTQETYQEITALMSLSGAAGGASTVFKGLGASMKAAFMSNPVGMILTIVTSVISLVSWMKTWKKSNEELIQQADEIKNTYKQESNTIQDNISTLQGLEDEFNKLSKGVDDYGNNISLATDDYKRYQEIVATITGMSPSLIAGYDAEGNALANKNGLLQQSIKLMQQEQQIKAKEYLSDKNVKKVIKGEVAQIDKSLDIMEPTGRISQRVMIEDDGSLGYGYTGTQSIANAIEQAIDVPFENQGIDKYIQENLELVQNNIDEILNNAGQNWVDEYGYTWKGFDGDQLAELESYINSVIDATNEASSGTRSLLQVVAQSKTGYYNLSDSAQAFLNQYVNSFNVTRETSKKDIKDMMAQVEEFSDFLIKNSEVEHVIEIGYKLGTGKDANNNTLNVAEYRKQVAEFKQQIQDSAYTDDQKNTLLSMFGLADDDAMDNDIEEAIQHVENILKGKAKELSTEAQSYLDNLTITEALHIKANISTDLSGLSVDELKKKVNETYSFDITNYTDAVSNHSAVISEYQEALQKLGKGSFTMDDFMALIKKYPDLAKGVDVSSNAFYGLSRNLNRAAKAKTKSFVKDLQKLKESLKAAGKSTDSIDQLIEAIENMPDDALDDTIDKYVTLSKEITNAKLANDRLIASMEENPNEGYETRGEAMEYMKEAMERGEIGSESNLWNVAKQYGFTYDSAKTINENADALAKYIAVRETWFKQDDDGNYTFEGTEDFVKTVEEAVDNIPELQSLLTWDYDETTGIFNADFDNENWDEIVKYLSTYKDLIGLTSDEWADMLVQIGQYFGINWEDEDDALAYLEEIKKKASENRVAATEEYGQGIQDYFGKNTTIDLTNRPVVSKEDMHAAGWTKFDRDYATTYSSTISNEDGSVAILATPILPDGKTLTPEQLDKYVSEIIESGTNPEEYEIKLEDGSTYKGSDVILNKFTGAAKEEGQELSEAEQAANRFGVALSEAQSEFQELKDPLNLDSLISAGATIEDLSKVTDLLGSLQRYNNGITVLDETAFKQVLADAGYTETQIESLIEKIKEYQNVTTVGFNDPLGLESTNKSIQTVVASLLHLGVNYKMVTDDITGEHIGINIEANDLITTLSDNGWTTPQITAYLKTLTDETNGLGIQVDGHVNMDDTQVQEAINEAKNIPEEENIILNVDDSQLASVETRLDDLDGKRVSTYVDTYETTKTERKRWNPLTGQWESFANGTAHAQGTAFAGGSWGVPKTETALVGELGPEMLVRNGRWTTVGENGAEFTQIKKGDIIFNHKQTEDLLSKGYVTGRGKAYASGTAYSNISGQFSKYNFSGEGGYTKYDVNGNALDTWGNAISSAAGSLSEAADSAEEFNEVFDWIEVRLEELEEQLSLFEAQVENAGNSVEKNSIIDQMIDLNNTKLKNLEAGYQKYSEYTEHLLTKIPEKYREAAQNGAIAIEEFVGEADETTLEAIENYREWAQKAADTLQQIEEISTTIRDLAVQRIDNAYTSGSVRTDVEDSQTERLQNRVDYWETKGYIPGTEYYGTNAGQAEGSTGMFENSYKKIEYLTAAYKEMQEEFNNAVANGEIEKGSDTWYEQLNELYAIQSEIDAAELEIEEFQNAINDIYWDNFDELISQYDRLTDENQNLIDLMSKEDMIADISKKTLEGGTEEYWTEDDVKFTDEAIASIGLYAQQMEIAEAKAKQYEKAMEDLTADYEAGKYSESEYAEKLAELKDGQYDAIQSYHDAQDAIVDIQKARVESIKEGIEKEIDAYSELIEKKKEALSSEKDLYDFQKSTMEQEKNIADIERKLAALANDTSMSAIAKRKQLEAELAEAQYELQDTYYSRSVEDKQSALDKEKEDFQESKEKEVEMWDEYLTNVETVVAESLGLVQENADGVYETLNSYAEEYGLTLSDQVVAPWSEGSDAISSYQEKFGTAASATTEQLDLMNEKWQALIDKMQEASEQERKAMDKENAEFAKAKDTKPERKEEDKPSKGEEPANKEKPTLSTGSYVEVKPGTKWYSDSYGGGASGNARSGIIKYINTNGSHAYNIDGLGWVRKKDIVGYAKGSNRIDEDQLALLHELGDELVLAAGPNGKLQYITKGTAIIPHDISENLMELGQLDPSEVLNRNRPEIIPSKSVVNNNMEIHMSIAEVVHIDKATSESVPDITKAVQKQMDSYMAKLNNAIKAKVR